jgi:hypothetical protein
MGLQRGRKPQENLISVPESDMTFIKDMLTKMNGKLNEMEISLIKLNQTVIGNKEYGQKGLVEQVNEHRKYIEEDKNYKAKVIGGVTVIGVIYGVLLKYWEKIF